MAVDLRMSLKGQRTLEFVQNLSLIEEVAQTQPSKMAALRVLRDEKKVISASKSQFYALLKSFDIKVAVVPTAIAGRGAGHEQGASAQSDDPPEEKSPSSDISSASTASDSVLTAPAKKPNSFQFDPMAKPQKWSGE